MNKIVQNNIKFNNIPVAVAKGYSTIITSVDNIVNKMYQYDPDSNPIFMALDINWGGIEVGENKVINTTGELISWIKSNNMLSDEDRKTLNECKELLSIIKNYLLENNKDDNQDDNQDNKDDNQDLDPVVLNENYWYGGVGPIDSSTVPGQGNGWHLIEGTPTRIETGDLFNPEPISWTLVVPVKFGLNNISNGENITDTFNVSTVTCANGETYKVFKQMSATKRISVSIIK